MTFSQKVKNEIVAQAFDCEECALHFLHGIFMFHKPVNNSVFVCDNEAVIDYVAQSIVEVSGVIATLIKQNKKEFKKHYRIAIENVEDMSIFKKKLQRTFAGKLDLSAIKSLCCKRAFLRGAFISCGVIVNPQKEYHLEFKAQNETTCHKLSNFLISLGVETKVTTRKGNFVVYTKESEQIENFLTFIEALGALFEIINIKIEKDVRNKVNRQTNCETANLQKTAKAAVQKSKEIKYIIDTKGIEFLPEELQEIALLRIMNPESSLNELTHLLGGEISRSALNYRLIKLQKIAKQLRESEEESD